MAVAPLAAQIRGSAAPTTVRRSAVPPGARVLRFAPSAAANVLQVQASLRRGAFRDLAAPGVASKSWTTMCVKADYTSPSVEQTGDEIQEPAIVAPANEEISTEQEVAPQQKCAKIHDFCLGIPFGGFLFSMGLIGFLFWRSPVSITFGVAPGLAILALSVLSLKVWRSGKSSLPFILAQAALAAAVAWKHSQAYITTKKLLPWGFYAALSYYPNSSPVSFSRADYIIFWTSDNLSFHQWRDDSILLLRFACWGESTSKEDGYGLIGHVGLSLKLLTLMLMIGLQFFFFRVGTLDAELYCSFCYNV